MKYYKKVRLLTAQEAQIYMPIGSYVTEISVGFNLDNDAQSYTLTTTPIDLTSLTFDETKTAVFNVSSSGTGWKAFCVMLYND